MKTPTTFFTGKAAIVTGAGGDIGRAVSLALVDAGARVLAVDVDDAALQQTVDASGQFGGNCEALRGDVSHPSFAETYAAAGARLGDGSIDLFFNNAGVEGVVASLVDMDYANFQRVMRVNVDGVFLGLQSVLPYMDSGGVVVNSASTASFRGSTGLGAYVASKHAVLGLTKTAALEVAPRGIRVVAVAAGAVDGRMMNSIAGQARALSPDPASALAAAELPAGSKVGVEDVRDAVMFLLSDQAGFVTGSALVVDGGRLAH